MANPPPKISWAAFVVLALLALAVRVPQLGNRPMHTDEAINAYITGDLLAGKNFQYDPQDRHGPALYVLAEPIARLCGAKSFSELTETQLRLTSVLVGGITVLLFGAGVELFGFLTCFVAALLFAISPLPVYYSRDFIHETLFVAATFGLMLSGWRALKTNSVIAATLAGLSGGLMLATKETAVIHFFALGMAAACGWLWNKLSRRWIEVPISDHPATSSPSPPRSGGEGRGEEALRAHGEEKPKFHLHARALSVALGVFVGTAILLFTWFGQNWTALTDLLHAVPRFAHRAGGEGHEKPFWYYALLLSGGWSGLSLLALAALGFVITIVGFLRQKLFSPILFISLYGLLIIGVYSAIPYKTPWLALNFWLPISLLIGRAVTAAWKKLALSPVRWLVVLPAALIAVAITHDTKNRVFRFPADEKNPYAYAQTVEGLLDLPPRLEQLAARKNLASPRIAVVAADPWPLPWYLRKFSQAGFWQPRQEIGSADFFITSPEAADGMSNKLSNLRPEFFGLRPEVVIILWSPQP